MPDSRVGGHRLTTEGDLYACATFAVKRSMSTTVDCRTHRSAAPWTRRLSRPLPGNRRERPAALSDYNPVGSFGWTRNGSAISGLFVLA